MWGAADFGATSTARLNVDSAGAAIGGGRVSPPSRFTLLRYVGGTAETLARFTVNGQPDWGRFESVLGAVIRGIRTRTDHGELRAYAEMAGLLWKSGRYSAAMRVEPLPPKRSRTCSWGRDEYWIARTASSTGFSVR